jgi:hypothetical protein
MEIREMKTDPTLLETNDPSFIAKQVFERFQSDLNCFTKLVGSPCRHRETKSDRPHDEMDF